MYLKLLLAFFVFATYSTLVTGVGLHPAIYAAAVTQVQEWFLHSPIPPLKDAYRNNQPQCETITVSRNHKRECAQSVRNSAIGT